MKIINASAYGFLPENDEVENTMILNRLLAEFRCVEVTRPGVYSIGDAVIIPSDRTLRFGDGVFIKREKAGMENSYVIVNSGAYTREYDENITIEGLSLICNGIQSDLPEIGKKMVIPGLRGHLSFFYVRNLTIKNVTILDLGEKDFGIHVCTFENLVIKNIRIEGKKDAVHLGRGRGFFIRDGYFKTFDDPIALNAHDYASSNPQLGWIENGVIENCYDYNDKDTTGFFTRILAGAWGNWYQGMKIRNSDTVVYNNKLYRALMNPDGEEYISRNPPSHLKGIEIADDINWVFVQEEAIYNCGCRNITFRNIYIEKDRPTAFSFHFDNDTYSRSVYPGSDMPVQENISFEKIYIRGHVPVFLNAITPMRNIKIIDSDLMDSEVQVQALEYMKEYPAADLEFKNTKCPKLEIAPRRKIAVIS